MKNLRLSPLDEPEILFEYVKNLNEDILIAGHLPHLSRFVSLLISGDKGKNIINFKMGSILCLSRGQEGWKVEWFLNPEIL